MAGVESADGDAGELPVYIRCFPHDTEIGDIECWTAVSPSFSVAFLCFLNLSNAGLHCPFRQGDMRSCFISGSDIWQLTFEVGSTHGKTAPFGGELVGSKPMYSPRGGDLS